MLELWSSLTANDRDFEIYLIFVIVVVAIALVSMAVGHNA